MNETPSRGDHRRRAGGDFLLGPAAPADCFTREDLADEHLAIGQLVDEFWVREVAPALPALFRQEAGVGRGLLRRAGALGLTSLHIPEAYGGQELDLPSIAVLAEHVAEDQSYSGWHMGHAGIGTLPIAWFGTEAQKRRYLPRLATAELMGAYALTEPQAGTDALGLRTRADLSADGRHYLLSGQKMWITGGGVADVFIVVAKVAGEALTAFIVERSFGVRHGAEEHKMGLKGTSTTALYFDQVAVPVDNVLGPVGQGHRIAFSVLNMGRLLIGPLAIRGARRILDVSRQYATERIAFGRPIADFGAIASLLADREIELFAIDAATWRVVGLIEAERLERMAGGEPIDRATAGAFDEFAAECSAVKVAASEMLDRTADAGVQIHGGYGYHADYFVERAYRDSRVNRIFEGTNEINRLLIPGMVAKRAARAGRPLGERAAAELATCCRGTVTPAGPDGGPDFVGRARQLTLAMVAAVRDHTGQNGSDDQDLTLRLADATIDTFVAESAMLRAHRSAGEHATTLAELYARDALARVARRAEEIFMATLDGARARAAVTAARALGAPPPANIIGMKARSARPGPTT